MLSFVLQVCIVASVLWQQVQPRNLKKPKIPGLKIIRKLPEVGGYVVNLVFKDEPSVELTLARQPNLPNRMQSIHCNYIGHVTGDKNGTIAALTGCIGKQDVVTSVVYFKDDSSKTHLWKGKRNGNVREVKVSFTEIMDLLKNDVYESKDHRGLDSERFMEKSHNEILGDELMKDFGKQITLKQ